MIPPILSAARLLCYINGQLTGVVRSWSMSSGTPTHEIAALDALDPYELAPTSTRVSGRIGLYRVLNLGAEGLGITAQFEKLSRQRYFTMQLVDRLSGLQVFAARYCFLELQDWEVVAKNLMIGNFSWRGITWQNELG